MVLLQQLMQVATQPSPVKATFTHDDVELAAVALLQHLVASSSPDVGRPQNFLPSGNDDDDVLHVPQISRSSDVPPQSVPVPSSVNATADSAVVANDDVAKHTPAGPSHRRHRVFAVRPPLPVVSQLIEMGFARRKAEAAVKHLGNRSSLLVCILEYLFSKES